MLGLLRNIINILYLCACGRLAAKYHLFFQPDVILSMNSECFYFTHADLVLCVSKCKRNQFVDFEMTMGLYWLLLTGYLLAAIL